MGKRGPKPSVDGKRGFQADPATPPAPPYLDQMASEEWTKFASLLRPVLTLLDQHALGIYCQSISNYASACAAIAEHGMLIEASNGSMKPNPALAERREAAAMAYRYGGLLGLSPADRAGMRVPADDGEKNGKGERTTGEFLAGFRVG